MQIQRLLLHTCCAPCSIVIIDELKNKYDLTVFFYNPNIHPEEEYLKRKKHVVQVCEEWGVKMVDMDYEVERWHEDMRGFETEPEGGARCTKCFSFRLDKTADYASKNGFDVYSTSLTSGRNKKKSVIGLLGRILGKKYGVDYLNEDWKKGGRQEKSRKMVEERGIYRQNYCGCKYSR